MYISICISVQNSKKSNQNKSISEVQLYVNLLNAIWKPVPQIFSPDFWVVLLELPLHTTDSRFIYNLRKKRPIAIVTGTVHKFFFLNIGNGAILTCPLICMCTRNVLPVPTSTLNFVLRTHVQEICVRACGKLFFWSTVSQYSKINIWKSKRYKICQPTVQVSAPQYFYVIFLLQSIFKIIKFFC